MLDEVVGDGVTELARGERVNDDVIFSGPVVKAWNYHIPDDLLCMWNGCIRAPR